MISKHTNKRTKRKEQTMEINETLTKQITETSYLTTENTKRYRPILRYFYEQYEKIRKRKSTKRNER